MFKMELLPPGSNDTPCGPLNEHHKQLISVLGMARIEAFLPGWPGLPGRPLSERSALARAFVAKAVFNLSTTRLLIEMLSVDKTLRRLCGWQRRGEVPSEATFSRAFAEFATSALPSRLHEALIQDTHADRLVGHISRLHASARLWLADAERESGTVVKRSPVAREDWPASISSRRWSERLFEPPRYPEYRGRSGAVRLSPMIRRRARKRPGSRRCPYPKSKTSFEDGGAGQERQGSGSPDPRDLQRGNRFSRKGSTHMGTADRARDGAAQRN